MEFERQIRTLGLAGQRKLEKAGVAIIGSGGLGTHVAYYLKRSGIGRILIMDSDRVEESNLPRTLIFQKKDIGKFKTEVVGKHLNIDHKTEKLKRSNIKVLEKFDVVVDCTDDMETRYAINEFCVKMRKPWVYGTCRNYDGFVSSFLGRPCLECLYPGKKPTDQSEGVITPAVGMTANLQVMEVIKILTGMKPLYGKLLKYSLNSSEFEILKIKPRKTCRVCG